MPALSDVYKIDMIKTLCIQYLKLIWAKPQMFPFWRIDHIYIYIYIYREREREHDYKYTNNAVVLVRKCVLLDRNIAYTSS